MGVPVSARTPLVAPSRSTTLPSCLLPAFSKALSAFEGGYGLGNPTVVLPQTVRPATDCETCLSCAGQTTALSFVASGG